VATPSSPAHLPRQLCSSAPRQPSPASFTSLASPRLQDKHQKLRESRRASSFPPSLPPLPSSSSSSSSSSPDHHPFRCHDDDLNKPKGKRSCKTKHMGGDTARNEDRDGGGSDDETSGKVSEALVLRYLTLWLRFLRNLRCSCFMLFSVVVTFSTSTLTSFTHRQCSSSLVFVSNVTSVPLWFLP